MEAVTKILAIITPFFVLIILWIALRLLTTAGNSMLDTRKVDPVTVGVILGILILIPFGIRVYPPLIMDAFIESFGNIVVQADELENVVKNMVENSTNDWNQFNEELTVVPDVPTVIIATPEFTATPFPTPAVNFAATATAYFENHPTAVPPQPTATLEPTRYVCRTIQDIQAGCTPPTPVPGN